MGSARNLLSMAGGATAALTSVGASLCCAGPAAIAVMGVNGAIFAAGLRPYRPILLIGSFLLLAFSHWSVYRRTVARLGAACSVRAGRISRVVLWIATAMWVAALFIQYFADLYWLEGGTL
ncbi:MAG: mercuric transporter MerT family protein [Candidatus Palauibacterales bacterium]|nr:mercuric transporter MerT family protein [Candidatus Palauibacterales bacterium]